MLYKKKDEPCLSKELFERPTSEFRGAPFWAWNTKLDDQTLLEQIDIFKQMGIGGFHMHVRTGMQTEYMSDEFFHFIKLCNEKAKKEDMLCWLYDEDRWPSGAAGGFVSKNNRYRQRFLVMDYADPATFRKNFGKNFEDYCRICEEKNASDGYMIARFGIKLDADNFLQEYKLLAEGESYDGTVVYAYMCVAADSGWYNGQSYIDTLNPVAVEQFLNFTYKAYAREVGEDFGKSIPGIFTDEPQFAARIYKKLSDEKQYATVPFTDDFEDTYRAAYGDSIIEKLPELFWEKRDHGCALTRYRFMDHVSERFVSAFVDTIGLWCEKNNIAFTGHMMNEPTLYSQTLSIGDAMRCYRNFQLPGIDLLSDRVELTTAKQTQSCVHQYGREGMLSELYGVSGWDFPFRGHKRQGDWQAALGVTVRVHHLTWVSMNGDAKHDYPASIGYQSPWYKEYKYIEDHFARLNTALTRGTPYVRVGVLHPVESYWMYMGPADKTGSHRAYLDEQFDKLTKALCFSGIDFDFISESTLPALCAKGGNPLCVGKMQYDCIVVPVMETMRASTLERLQAFTAEGGKVILLGQAPQYVDARACDGVKKASASWTQLDVDYLALVEALNDFRLVSFTDLDRGVPCESFLHQVRSDGNDKWLFFCHGADYTSRLGFVPAFSSEQVRVTLNGAFDLTEYNTLTGEIYTPAYTVENGKTLFERTVFHEDSVLLKLTPTAGDKKVAGNAPKQAVPFGCEAIALNKPSSKAAAVITDKRAAKVADKVSFTLDEPNVILLDKAVYSFDGEPWQEEEDSARIGDIGRKRFYSEHTAQTVVQPWVPVPDELKNDPGHTVKRRFTFYTDIVLKDARLALEMADTATVWVNGTKLEKKDVGWFTDRCIRCLALPEIPAGQVVIDVETHFDLRGRTEWIYVLGSFGVRVDGRFVTAVPAPEKLVYGDMTRQGYPFYTGNVTYHTTYEEAEGGERTLQVSDFGGALVKVKVDGVDKGVIALAPYCLALGNLEKGVHSIDITVFGTRFNAFGPVHNNVKKYAYWGPNSWKTYDSPMWTDTYVLRPAGILNSPVIY